MLIGTIINHSEDSQKIKSCMLLKGYSFRYFHIMNGYLCFITFKVINYNFRNEILINQQCS